MERTMSVEEKIRKAEEIYNRRNQDSYYTYNKKSKEKKGPTLKHRMIKQMIICIIVYGIFYVVTNREYFMSQEFQEKVKYVASQNEYLNNAYNYLSDYISKYFNGNIEQEKNENTDKEDQAENTQQENNQTQVNDLEKNDENIGGAEEIKNGGNQGEQEKTQEEKDVEDIKNTISFINPIEGRISSAFGWRTPTTQSVPKNHTGLDIAAPQGTVIKSATQGKIILASSEGDYGNHYKIQINDVIIIYAHCNKLYLKEGDEVTQGQEIAEVGTTGNSTGPHLHFEIRKGERLINPELILDI